MILGDFDATIPTNGMVFVAGAEEWISLQAGNEPTLQVAMAQVRSGDRDARGGFETLLDRHEVTALDLWLGRQSPSGDLDATPLRPLKPDEMLLIAGGSGSDISVLGPPPFEPDYWDENPYDPGDNDPYPDGGGGGGSGDGQSGGPEEIDLTGRDCPVDQAAARAALNSLYANSPTARGLIDAMVDRGTDLSLIAANLAGGGPQARFDPGTNQVLWDPFVYATGTNSNGSTYTLAPIMILAHELVHAGHADDPAYLGADSEALVMQIANQIAMEMNAALGSSYETGRDSHIHTARNWTNSSTSTTFSIARPGCS